MIISIMIAIIGLACLYAEFFLPGGILGVFAFLLLLVSILLFFGTGTSLGIGLIYLICMIAAVILVCRFALRGIRKSNNSFCLQKDQEGFVSAEFEEDLVGKEGIVCSELKPAGHVRIQGKVYQALSQGEFLVNKTPIEVVSMRGSHLIVKLKKKENV